MSASTLQHFLLRSLKHPRAQDINPDDPVQFCGVLVWLENTRIRLYPIDGRRALQSGDPAEWRAALQNYLADIDCPIKYDGANHRAVLQWLLMHAVGLEYTDASQQLNQVTQDVESKVGPPEEWTEAQLPPLPDITTDRVCAALLQLQQLLHIERGGAASGSNSASGGCPVESTPEGLQRAHTMLETCVLPALAELAKQQQQAFPGGSSEAGCSISDGGGGTAPLAAATATQHVAVAAMLAQYPLGFSTGDGGTDLAATILRMLYIKDLRALQTLVDSAIVQVQEYTANPRTDASLGKVGR